MRNYTDCHTHRKLSPRRAKARDRFFICLALLFAVFIIALATKAEPQDRLSTTTNRDIPREGALVYHPVEIYVLAQGGNRHTHVKTTGYRTFILQEADGDIHVRTCDDASTKGMDRTHCIVVECIPEIPCNIDPADKLLIGKLWTVCGNWRFDPEKGHNWNELHPWRPCTGVPPTSTPKKKGSKHDKTQVQDNAAAPAGH